MRRWRALCSNNGMEARPKRDITAEKDTAQTNVEALLAANPSNTLLKTDVDTTISVSTAAARTALRDSATTTLTTDVDAVIAAFPA